MIKEWEWYCRYQWGDQPECEYRGTEKEEGAVLVLHRKYELEQDHDSVWVERNIFQWEEAEAFPCHCDSKDKCPYWIEHGAEIQRQNRIGKIARLYDKSDKSFFKVIGKEITEATDRDVTAYERYVKKYQKRKDRRDTEHFIKLWVNCETAMSEEEFSRELHKEFKAEIADEIMRRRRNARKV